MNEIDQDFKVHMVAMVTNMIQSLLFVFELMISLPLNISASNYCAKKNLGIDLEGNKRRGQMQLNSTICLKFAKLGLF